MGPHLAPGDPDAPLPRRRMALGPDPNRDFDVDHDLTGDEQARGGGMGSPRGTRAGMPTWAIVVAALLLAGLVLALVLR